MYEMIYFDMPFCLFIVDECSNALHEVRGVLIMIVDDAHTARRVVGADIVTERVEVALDKIGCVSGSVGSDGDERRIYVRRRARLTSA